MSEEDLDLTQILAETDQAYQDAEEGGWLPTDDGDYNCQIITVDTGQENTKDGFASAWLRAKFLILDGPNSGKTFFGGRVGFTKDPAKFHQIRVSQAKTLAKLLNQGQSAATTVEAHAIIQGAIGVPVVVNIRKWQGKGKAAGKSGRNTRIVRLISSALPANEVPPVEES